MAASIARQRVQEPGLAMSLVLVVDPEVADDAGQLLVPVAAVALTLTMLEVTREEDRGLSPR